MYNLAQRPRLDPFDAQPRRGHRHAGGELGADQRERHWVVAGVVAAVIGAAASAYAAYSAGQAQQAQANYNKKVALNAAEAAKNAAEVERQLRQERYRRQLGAQRVALGASGIAPEEGSPLLLQMDSAEQAALDLARVTYRGRVGAMTYQAEANLQQFVGQQASRAGTISAGTSLLSGVGNAAVTYGRATAKTPTPATGQSPYY